MADTVHLQAPFPWFGGKRRVAAAVWARFGDVTTYVEPFFGSGAVLLGRPRPWRGIEVVNDRDGYVANFWRALAAEPETVAHWADWPVLENDLHARHSWLAQQRETLRARLEGDPHWYDPQIAGWWVWGVSCWIGGQFCGHTGPWVVTDGQLVRGHSGDGISRRLIHIGGRGVHRRLTSEERLAWCRRLAERLRHVRVCCGDWSRVCTSAVVRRAHRNAVFLDPPYADTAGRDPDLYTEESVQVAHAVRAWALAHGDDPRLRIALCGYEGEHKMPPTWQEFRWRAHPGYGVLARVRSENWTRERIWFSPHCLPASLPLLEEVPR